jgi:hypothetical protein
MTTTEEQRQSRRIGGDTDARTPLAKLESRLTLLGIEFNDLRARVNVLEMKPEMEQFRMEKIKATAIQMYGSRGDLAEIKSRAMLHPSYKSIGEEGLSYLVQVCFLMNWNPFFDCYAFKGKNGQICIIPEYKKLIENARQAERIQYDTRPMDQLERDTHGLNEGEIGFRAELVQVDTAIALSAAGLAHLIKPLVGWGVWKKGDNVPTTWTPAMVAEKRALRNLFKQLQVNKEFNDRFHTAMQQAAVELGAKVEESEDGYNVELAKPGDVIEGDFTEAKLKPRPAPEADPADDLNTTTVLVEQSKPAPHVPPARNKPAAQPEASADLETDGETEPPKVKDVGVAGDAPVLCAKCHERPAVITPQGTEYCALCARRVADAEIK